MKTTVPQDAKAQTTAGVKEEGPAGTKAYKEWLKTLSADVIPDLKNQYSRRRLAEETLAAAQRHGVSPQLVWGVMYRESSHTPVGVTKIKDKKDPKTGKLKISTALGVGQMTRSRWRQERKAGSATAAPQHWHLVYPSVSVDVIAESYARGYAERGETPPGGGSFTPPAWAGDHWAGAGKGDRKLRDIQEHGPDFWAALAEKASV